MVAGGKDGLVIIEKFFAGRVHAASPCKHCSIGTSYFGSGEEEEQGMA